jgi:Flp pilus assembly protein TadG
MHAWIRQRDRDETALISLWLLGLSVMLLMLGGVSIDLWHVFSERRALVGIADAAAYAGASGLDEAAFRDRGDVVLSPTAAKDNALAAITAQQHVVALDAAPEITVTSGAVTVTLQAAVELTLLRLLAPGIDTIGLAVTSTAEPHLGG